MVADVMGSVPVKIELFHALSGPKLWAWEILRGRLAHIQLTHDVGSLCTSARVYIPPANSWYSQCMRPWWIWVVSSAKISFVN
jgi:hypothetical protein